MQNLIENTPNARKLISSLRNTGYDNLSAIADLVDNSIDADAKRVKINIKPVVDDVCITIADDGSGMDYATLDQALRLGSDTDRNETSDLGKFGMGLVTASISLARRLTVITKKDNIFLTSIQDLDEIAESGRFEKELHQSTAGEEKAFRSELGNVASGTLVILDKCDRLQHTRVNEFCKHMVDYLGQVFRIFIRDGGKAIFVRDIEIPAVDPMVAGETSTDIYSDDSFEIETVSGKENLRIRIGVLPDYGKVRNQQLGINQQNSGFYLLRNNREIATGETLGGIFTKHNDLNRLRIELYFSGNIDNEMGINFTKRDAKPIRSIIDKITQRTYPQISSIRRRMKKEQGERKDEKVDHSDSAKAISEKTKLLINPKITFTPRRPTGEHPGTVAKVGTDITRGGTGATSRAQVDKLNCEFLIRSSGPTGKLFESDMFGKKIVISYNADHPFYQEFIAANRDDKDIVNTIDFLVYSIASAKLTTLNKDNENTFETFETILSANLRTLLN